jgi:hypothetical protein
VGHAALLFWATGKMCFRDIIVAATLAYCAVNGIDFYAQCALIDFEVKGHSIIPDSHWTIYLPSQNNQGNMWKCGRF